MPRASATSRVRDRMALPTSTTSSLPPPDMTEVQRLIDNAIAKARLAAQKERKNSSVTGGARSQSSSRVESGSNFASPVRHQKLSGCLKDFLWAFVATFFVIYITVTGYSMYRRVMGIQDAL